MVEFERREVPCVAADHATTAQFQHQLDLPDPASLQLLAVALVVVVRVPVLAVSRAEDPLFAAQAFAANDAVELCRDFHGRTLLV